MYTEFFGLNEKPFSITPDPRYLYMSRRHADALAHLLYGISESGGFIQLTGEVGTGKTTLIRSLLEQLPEKAEIALVLYPPLSPKEFLRAICEELRTPKPADSSVKALIDSLNTLLLALHSEGRRAVLIVDEAQTLRPPLLEQVRLLTNLETAKQKLLQIILIGQPELRDVLDRPDMRQVAQRITGRYHLEPLNREDSTAYIKHRLRVAGTQSEVFKPSAIRALYRQSRGIPRLINIVADRALLAAYTQDKPKVDGALVRRAAAELFGRRRPGGRWWPWMAGGIGIASFALATTNLWRGGEEYSTPPLAMEASVDGSSDARAGPRERRASGALLEDAGFATGADGAVGELLSLWGASYDAARRAPCEQAAEQGLRCLLEERGSISELRRINRPAALTLVDDAGAKRQVVMARLGYDSADLVSAGERLTIDLAELAHSWGGEALLLWRPATRTGNELVPGVEDEDVLWLRESMSRVRGQPMSNGSSAVYDQGLEAYVKEYQRQHLLTVDGIVGARTQIALATDLGAPGTPLLIEDR